MAVSIFVSIRLSSHDAMTRHLNYLDTPDPFLGRATVPQIWEQFEPATAGFENLDEIVGYLGWAATRLRRDPVLSALCRLAFADEKTPTAETVLLDGFGPELGALVGAIRKRFGPREHEWADLNTVLLDVVSDAVTSGEEPSGRAIVSRTWAKAYLAAALPGGSIWRSEVLAGWDRGRLWAAERFDVLALRRLAYRLAGRFVTTADAAGISNDVARTGGRFSALCKERGISPLAARLRLLELRGRPPAIFTHFRLMKEAVGQVHDEARRHGGEATGAREVAE